MTIGVFDSGLGGQMVAERLKPHLPGVSFQVVNDRSHLPYGDKSIAEITQLTEAAIQPLLGTCPIIALACNTATAAAIDHLRQIYPETRFVGFEPMIKPATDLTETRRIVMLATAATRLSARYKNLVTTYAGDNHFIEPDTTGWASLIENGKADQIDLTEITTAVRDGADVIVLACTHYLALQDQLCRLAPKATIIEPTEAIAAQIKRLMSQLGRQTAGRDRHNF